MNVRPFNDRDLYQVLDLMSKNYNRPYTKEWWEWKYKKNPFGKSIIWVSENDNKIVGSRSFWAWRLQFRGNIYKAYLFILLRVSDSVN